MEMVSEQIENLYNDLLNEGENLYADYGRVTEEKVNTVIENVERIAQEFGKKNLRRIFFISVELMQNVYHHALRGIEHGIDTDFFYYVFSKIGNKFFKISAGNFVNRRQYLKLMTRIEQLNLLQPGELRVLYKKILINNEFSEKGGGGLGIIEMLRKSDLPIDYRIISFNKNLFFFNFSLILENKK